VYSRLVLAIRLRYTIPVALAAIIIATFLHQSRLHEVKQETSSVERTLDHLSSYRTAMWRRALANPPDNIWLGVGMGNVGDHPEIFTIRLANKKEVQIGKHLHNFVLDCWYANGLLGLATLLTWLGFLIKRSLRNWRHAEGLLRIQVGTLIAASFAIMSNAFLSYSYGSKQFGVYLFTFLIVAAYARSEGTFDLPENDA
jgi:O-antigen ligase